MKVKVTSLKMKKYQNRMKVLEHLPALFFMISSYQISNNQALRLGRN